MLSTELAEQIAFNLVSPDSRSVAFLQDGDVIYYSVANPVAESPIIALIQAVYDHAPEHARRILRARIFSTETMNEASHGMTKVAAKRATGSLAAVNRELPLSFEFRKLSAAPPPPLLALEELTPFCRKKLTQGKPMAAAFALAEEIGKREQRYECDRKVAAILLHANGAFIAAAKNANSKNRTRHAELNLIQGLRAEKNMRLPLGAQLYVTLKCCKMCAGLIASMAEDIRTNHVYYGANDPGPLARATVLDRYPGLQSLLTSD